MAANESALFCDICQNRDMDKPLEENCSQCEEALCGDCLDHHKISKLSKSHQTISIDKQNKLPSFVKPISYNGEEHDCILEFHCKFHDSFCCKLCLVSCHKECKEATYIDAFITPSSGHQSAALDNIAKVLKDLDSNICSALKDRNRNLTELREQKVMIRKHIKNKRHEITCILDLLEGNLLEKPSALEKKYCQEIEAVIAKLEDEKKESKRNSK